MILSLILMMSAAHASDFEKHPCLIHAVQPASCAGDDWCIHVVNRTRHALAPVIEGVCGEGKMTPVGLDGTMQAILDPLRSTEERQFLIPVLAPIDSTAQSDGWMNFPKVGPMGPDGVREALTHFVTTARAFGGTFNHLFDLFVSPGRVVKVFDDDAELDIEEHGPLGTCLKKSLDIPTPRKTLEYSGDCGDNELLKNQRASR